eukprot:TRINITY_DN3074_c0_g1_i1.p1 TRINITY_DN3074_c0_g1~~TRINITY_DN3074_c0_g1_i1.p1  ORF type:complete len:214 (+),score=39.76 TRINITY_DN3074_c0_g1_i1:344-985(+)
MDRKVQRCKDRMEEQNAKAAQLDPEQRDRLAELSRDIVGTTNRMESLSEEGDVDGAHRLMQEVEKLKSAKDAIMQQVNARVNQPGVNRLISVCDICSAFTMSGDNEQRITDHLTGKQHVGYQTVRDKLKELRAARLKQGKDPPVVDNTTKHADKTAHECRGTKRERDEDSSRYDRRDRDRDRGRSRDRNRDRDRDHDRRDRDRDRDRYRDRKR